MALHRYENPVHLLIFSAVTGEYLTTHGAWSEEEEAVIRESFDGYKIIRKRFHCTIEMEAYHYAQNYWDDFQTFGSCDKNHKETILMYADAIRKIIAGGGDIG